MASDASEVPSTSSGDQRDDGTHLAPTSPDTGVPADPNCGKDSLKATTGKAHFTVLFILLVSVKWPLT